MTRQMTRRPWIPNTRAWGVGLALATAVISGFAIFINSYGVRAWADAGASTATYTTAKNVVAAFFLSGLLYLMSRAKSSEGLTLPTRRSQWLGVLAVGLIGGSVPFLLFFEGLTRATSTQAAFLHKTLLIWVVLLAVPILKERLSLAHVGALALLVWGQLSLAGGISDLSLGSGELMVLAATLMWSAEVIIAKRLLNDLSPLTLGTARMTLGAVVLLAYGFATGSWAGIGLMSAQQWGWALATGLVLTGYVATWYSGLARAQAIDVTAVLVFGAVITSVLRSGFEGAPIAPQGVGLLLLTAGAGLVVFSAVARTRLFSR